LDLAGEQAVHPTIMQVHYVKSHINILQK